MKWKFKITLTMPSAWLTSWMDLRDFRRSLLLIGSFSIFLLIFSCNSLVWVESGIYFLSERKSNSPIGHVIMERNGTVAFPFLKSAWTKKKWKWWLEAKLVVVRSCSIYKHREKQAIILEFFIFFLFYPFFITTFR